jgi:hypothetical protein
MEDLENIGVRQKALEVRGAGLSQRDLDEVRVPVAGRQLNNAQAVPVGVEAHRLAVDRDGRAEVEVARKVAEVKVIGHGFSCLQ